MPGIVIRKILPVKIFIENNLIFHFNYSAISGFI